MLEQLDNKEMERVNRKDGVNNYLSERERDMKLGKALQWPTQPTACTQ